MVNSYTAFWTAATVAVASLCLFEYYKKNKDVTDEIEEVGESNVHLEQTQHPMVQEAIDERDQRLNTGANNEDRARNAGAEWDNDDRARQALEEMQARQAQDEQRLNNWKQKGTVGTKKAKSLQKRDQRRAYFEYVRQEADRERERIQLEEDMFGDLVAEEREERQKRIEQARKELDESNRKRRKQEEEERTKRNLRRQEIKAAMQTKGIFRLKNDTDIELADEMSNVHVLDSGEYAVCLTPQIIEALSKALKTKGSLTAEEFANTLTSLYA